MRKEKCEVRSQGKVVDNIEVLQFDTIKEAVDKLGDGYVLLLVNKGHKAQKMNSARTLKTRSVSGTAMLLRAAKQDPALQAEIAALLKKHGLGSQPGVAAPAQ